MREADYPIIERQRKADGAELRLRRARRASSGPAVVMLHGGNTSSDTFLFPAGGLADFLARPENGGWDVWLLDWRGSPEVIAAVLARGPHLGDIDAERRTFALDTTVDVDLPAALRYVRDVIGERPLSLVGHCLSGCALAMALARGRTQEFGIQAYVLSTLGLHYVSCWDSWLKAEDYVVERMLADESSRSMHPARADEWPDEVAEAYRNWPRVWLPQHSTEWDDPLTELAFMFGKPYARATLHPELFEPARGFEARGPGSVLTHMFGHMHLGLFLHVGQMVRRGHAAPLDTSQEATGDLRADGFRDQRVTILTGSENRLWHRDSVDRTYEFLRSQAGGTARVRKHVFPGYGHQDLYWGPRAHRDVFPKIRDAIG
jgi:pimeloyl-ACP methyl ester carboxylesterase